MKKKLLIGLCAILLLCGCAKEKEKEEDIVGGYAFVDEIHSNVEGEYMDLFTDATYLYTGVLFDPIALLGTQVVAGTNYMFLCKGTTVTSEPTSSLYMVVIYKDLSGVATIGNVKEIDMHAITGDFSLEENNQILAGGWSNFELTGTTLNEDYTNIYRKYNQEGLPVTVLASQVVAGTNYLYLVYNQGNYSFQVVYDGINGDGEIIHTYDIDLGKFNN